MAWVPTTGRSTFGTSPHEQLKPLTIEALLATSNLEVGIEALLLGYRWD